MNDPEASGIKFAKKELSGFEKSGFFETKSRLGVPKSKYPRQRVCVEGHLGVGFVKTDLIALNRTLRKVCFRQVKDYDRTKTRQKWKGLFT